MIWQILQSMIIVTQYNSDIINYTALLVEEIGEVQELFNEMRIDEVVKLMTNQIEINDMSRSFQSLHSFISIILETLKNTSLNGLQQRRTLKLLGELTYLSWPLYSIVYSDFLGCLLHCIQRNREDEVRLNAAMELSVLLPRVLIPSEEYVEPLALKFAMKKRMLESCLSTRAVANIIHQGLNQKTTVSKKLNLACLEALHAISVPVEEKSLFDTHNQLIKSMADDSLGITATFRVASFSFDSLCEDNNEPANYFLSILNNILRKKMIVRIQSVIDIIEQFCKLPMNSLIHSLIQVETLIQSCILDDSITPLLRRKNIHRTLLGFANRFNTPELQLHRDICAQLARKIDQSGR